MAAALPPRQDELACAVPEEALQQAWRRDMQVRRDAVFFELASLGRTAASDDCVAWPYLADLGDLRLAQIGGYEAQHAHAPGALAHLPAGFAQEMAHFLAIH